MEAQHLPVLGTTHQQHFQHPFTYVDGSLSSSFILFTWVTIYTDFNNIVYKSCFCGRWRESRHWNTFTAATAPPQLWSVIALPCQHTHFIFASYFPFTRHTHTPFLSPYPSLYRAPVSESAYSAYCRWPIAANWFLQLEARTHTHRSHVWLQKKTEMTQLWTWSSETCLALTSLVAQISTTCACDVSERGFCFYFLPRPTIDKLH